MTNQPKPEVKGVEQFRQVERTRWVSHAYEGYSPWPEEEAGNIVGDSPDLIKITVPASDYDDLFAFAKEQQSRLKAMEEVVEAGKKLHAAVLKDNFTNLTNAMSNFGIVLGRVG